MCLFFFRTGFNGMSNLITRAITIDAENPFVQRIIVFVISA